jgi:hypothetical protein
LVLLTLAPASGCQPDFSGLDFEGVSSPPSGVTTIVRDDEIEIPEGIAIAVRVTPHSSNLTPYDSTNRVELRGRDEAILDVEPTEEERVWVLIGIDVGSTCVEVEIDGREQDCIDASVVAD